MRAAVSKSGVETQRERWGRALSDELESVGNGLEVSEVVDRREPRVLGSMGPRSEPAGRFWIYESGWYFLNSDVASCKRLDFLNRMAVLRLA